MFKEEAMWIKEQVSRAGLINSSVVLDVGSSSEEFRTIKQSYIDEQVFKPLRDKGIKIVHLDKKNQAGVDLMFDIENADEKDIENKYDLVLCCNLLEHVNRLKAVCGRLVKLTKKKGFLLVTVPKVYRYHLDPIDTLFRPRMKELMSFFPELKVISKKTIYIRDREKYDLRNICEFLRYWIPCLNWKINCLLMSK